MTEISKYIIQGNATVREALIALNNLSHDVLTLIIVNDDNQMIGALTDGDVRRKLIEGCSIHDPVCKVMSKNFHFVELGHIEIETVRALKKSGISLLPCLDKYKHIVHLYNLKEKRSMLPIDAVLMAGGKGERLRPLTENVPKPLLLVGEKPIIDYNVDRLISFGVEHISVTINYLGEQIEAHYKESHQGVKIECVKEPKYLGTIGSVKFVDTFINDTVLIMNSDLFTNIDYEDFYLHFKNNEADMSVAAVPYSVSVPYGIFELNGREIQGVREKPIYNYYANAGIYLIKRSLLKLIPEDQFYNATDFIEMLINSGLKVIRFPVTGYWIDIGKHEDLKKAQELVKHL